MKDFYYILGTDIHCTSIEINEAYRNLSQKFRPDLNENSPYFEQRFKEITEAYQTLSDPELRRRYNAALEKAKPQPPGYSKTKRTDILFTGVLILLTVGFGYYIILSVRGTKAAKANPVVVAAPAPVIKHHKKKHKWQARVDSVMKTKVIAVPDKTITDSVKIKPVAKPVLPVTVVKDPVKETPPIAVTPITNSTYEAYIHANATGVVYMRQLDNYTSAVVKVIPGNTKVTVLEKGLRYCKIEFNNQTGFVPAWTVHEK